MLFVAFSCCLVIIVYPVVVYPLIVFGCAWARPKAWQKSHIKSTVAFIVTVHNEEQRIRQKLEDTLRIRSPGLPVEFIVVSDGSTDGTRDVVAEFHDLGVRWIDCPRRGKEAAQIVAIRATAADVLVFSDAATRIERDGLVEILRPFADASVGAVSGTDMVTKAGSLGEDLYLRYEMALRRAESLCSSIIGLSGCFFAVRREVALELVDNVPSDLGAALVSIRQNRRAVGQPSARCWYTPTPGAGSLFRRMRRTVLRGIRCLWVYRAALSWHRPLASWQIISHKWLRFLSPLFAAAAIALAATAAILGQTWGVAVCAATAGLFVLGVLSFSTRLALLKAFRPAGFLLITYAAVVAAWFSLLAGEKGVTWTPTTRS
jgi:cellulose synthase/poly-beta-1,6-N-acetylglucosamine synthase-like glycosyltransferase